MLATPALSQQFTSAPRVTASASVLSRNPKIPQCAGKKTSGIIVEQKSMHPNATTPIYVGGTQCGTT